MLKTTWSHLLLDAVISHLASIIAFIERLLTAIGLPHLASHVRDYYWMVAAVVLRPFSSSAPGFFERRCLARAMRVDPPLYSIEVRSVATAQVNDGKNTLRGTLWLPRGEPGPFPSLIIRSPYGAQDKSAEWGQMFLAERGYAVLFQDTRGRFGSDGDFVPVEHEKEDGAATVRWVRSQPWCDGRIGVFGPSYLGFTTWAMIGACAAGELQAAIPTITQAVVRPAIFHHNGAIASELLVLWFYLIEVICLPSLPKFVANVYACWRDRRLSKAFMHAPLAELDEWLVGKPWDFFQAGVREPYDDDSPFWAQRSTLCELRKEHPECVTPPPVWIVTGLHDFFAEQALIDFTRAAALQPACQLIVAPFSHWDFVTLSGWQVITHATVMCVREHLPTRHQPYPVDKNSSAARIDSGTPPWRTPGRTQEELALPVQLCFLGSLRWRGFKAWPPPPTRVATFWLTATKGLQTKPPLLDGDAAAAAGGSCSPTLLEYTYTPSAPTPAMGGPSFNPFNAGGASQRSVERRDDVLVFTTQQLAQPLCLAGTATLQLRVWASARSVDVVARLCRVDKRGRSYNLCEGLTRVDAAKGEPSVGAAASGVGRLVTVVMRPLAVDLGIGERLRLHVCSAAHPRWMRNLLSDPEVPLHAQRPGASSCTVRLGVGDEEGFVTVPVVDDE